MFSLLLTFDWSEVPAKDLNQRVFRETILCTCQRYYKVIELAYIKGTDRALTLKLFTKCQKMDRRRHLSDDKGAGSDLHKGSVSAGVTGLKCVLLHPNRAAF